MLPGNIRPVPNLWEAILNSVGPVGPHQPTAVSVQIHLVVLFAFLQLIFPGSRDPVLLLGSEEEQMRALGF